jgi:putative restriction endonuclease
VERKPWAENEILRAVALYYQIPFGAIDEKNPAIIELARTLNRTAGAVALKLANFASLDPTVISSGRRGMANASKLDRKVFEGASGNWAQLAEELPQSVLEAIERRRIESKSFESVRDTEDIAAEGVRITEALATVMSRRGQDFFRNATLAAYRGRCCVTLLPVRELLRASHIIPWSIDPLSRLDPRNGLCLNTLYDAAFDRGLMTIDEQHRVIFSARLRAVATEDIWNGWFAPYAGRTIELPERLLPRPAALLFHREHVFSG